jgi:hypothetical protein
MMNAEFTAFLVTRDVPLSESASFTAHMSRASVVLMLKSRVVICVIGGVVFDRLSTIDIALTLGPPTVGLVIEKWLVLGRFVIASRLTGFATPHPTAGIV